jgi:hypothetical protein
MIPKLVWTILELYLTGVIHLLTACVNPFGVFGSTIPNFDPVQLTILLGNYHLRKAFVSDAFTIDKIDFAFGVEFSLATYTLTFVFHYFSIDLLLGTSIVSFWKSSLPNISSAAVEVKENSLIGLSFNNFITWFGLLPTIRLRIDRFKCNVNNKETVLAVRGIKLDVEANKAMAIRLSVDDLNVRDSACNRPIVESNRLQGTLCIGAATSVDSDISSISLNIGSLSDSILICYLHLFSGMQYYVPNCSKSLWSANWNELDLKLREIEQIRIDRQGRWRGDELDNDLFFYDTSCGSVVAQSIPSVNIMIGKFVLEANADGRSEDDIVCDQIKVESKTIVEKYLEFAVQTTRSIFSIRNVCNRNEEGVNNSGEFMVVETQQSKNYNQEQSNLLQVSSNVNCAIGDLTVAISASVLRNIVTILDQLKFLVKRGPLKQAPVQFDTKLYGQEKSFEFSSGTINLLVKSDEVNGPNSLQQNLLIRIGHGTKYLSANRYTVIIDSIQLYLGNCDVDVHSVDGMMLYGNAIVALKTLSVTLPGERSGTYTFPYVSNSIFNDWVVNANGANSSELVTDVSVKSISVNLSQSDIITMAFISKSITKNGSSNNCNIFESLKVHSYCLMPSYKRTTRIIVGDISLNISTENPLQRYRILHNKFMKLKLSSIGNWWSSTTFKMSDDIEILYFDGLRGSTDRMLVKVWSITGNDEDSTSRYIPESLGFSQTSSFGEFYCTSQKAIGIGFPSTVTSIRIPKLSMVLDVEDIKPILVVKAAYQTCYPVESSANETTPGSLYRSEVLFVTKTPSSVFHFDNKQLKISMYHTADNLRLPAVEITSSSLEIGQVDFAGCSSQLSIGISNLKVCEMSNPLAAHKIIVDSIDGQNYVNKLHIHITSVQGENGVFELHGEYLRVMYLQRSTMTLVTFFRDHFFGAMSEISSHVPRKAIIATPAPLKGLYRVCMVVRKSEFHMPSSSSGNDSLTVYFRRLIFYRTTDEYEKRFASYVKGPFHSRKMWLSELPQIRKLISFVYGRHNLAENAVSGSVVNWKLPVYLHEFMYMHNEVPNSEGYLRLQLFEGAVTSWCNNNLICSAMDVSATIKMNPSYPNAEEPFETFEGESYLMPAYTIRNTIIVEVFADDIEWVMAQGQYWLIVNSIQQNFMEWNYHIIDPFILPIFKKVELGERIFGADPIDRTFPIASSVPVHIKKGSIIAAENDGDFLKNFIAFMPVNEKYDESFHHNFDRQLAVTIPENSPFHRFRDSLFGRWARSETKREKLKEFHHGLETPFAIKFENLFLDFYRFHFGGGNGIEASATTLVIQQQARSESVSEGVRAQFGSSFDDTDIRDLVLAPRHLPVFRSKDSNRSGAPGAPVAEEGAASPSYEVIRHIRYCQQGVANLRRCVVYISDTVVTVNLTTILAAVDFFVIPIQLTSQRNLQLVEQMNKGPFDYRAGLDVEVHMVRSYVCIPDPVNGFNALCFDVKLDYAQSLRGFLNVGPGLVLMDVDADINSIFMAPLNEVNDIFMKPLVDPVKFRFLNEYTVLAPREALANHLDLMHSWTHFSSWVTELHNRYDRASGHRIMRFFIGPLITEEEIEDEINSYVGKVEEPKIRVIRGQCSIKDLIFIVSVVNGIRKSLKRRIQNLPKEDIYRSVIMNVEDMKHLMTLDEQLVYTPWTYDLSVDVKEVHAELSNFDFHVRNNTYNVNIGRLKLEDIIIIYARSPDHMHMATEVRLDAWTFNDDMDDWEPFIEPIQLRALGATDESRSVEDASEALGVTEAPSIRIDVITEGLEINAQQQALTSLFRKIRLGDVLTTSSNRLPPYMIINELGVNCKFTIGIHSTIVLASEIQVAASYPVEVSRLADSLNTFKRQRAFQVPGEDDKLFSNMDRREYFIWISFSNFSHSYESKGALCIDKVGVHPFEMQMLRGGGKRDSQAFRKSADITVDTQSNVEPMRYAQELPYAILDMRIKEDGVRELHLRGWLSFKNTTSRLMQISLRLYGSCFDSSLAPGKEWHAPVRFANPKAQLFIRFDHKSDWIEALPYLGMIIAGGSWGCPSKLRARLCRCFREHDYPDTTDEPRWILLIRPEAKSVKTIGLATSSSYKASSILVKYPNRDNNTKTKFGVGQMIDEGPDNFQIDDGQISSVISGTVTGFSANFLALDQSQIRPVCINLQAPLQFCSFLPQPLLYRLVDQEGTYCASGVLLPGQTFDIHNIPHIFQRRLMISVRLLNYAWSDFVIVFGRSNPFSNAEKSSELTMQSLLFQSHHGGKDILLPSLSLTMIIKEFYVRFTCQIVISNYSGQELNFSESGNTDQHLPLGSVASVRDYLDANVPVKRKSLHGRASARRNSINYTAETFIDSDDEVDSRGSGSDNGQPSDHPTPDLSSVASAVAVPQISFSGGRQSPVPSMEAGTFSRFKQIINLKIHLPQDHQKCIEVVASSSWTLEDLFMDIKHLIDNHGLQLYANDFKFFPWIIDEKLLTAKHIQPLEDGEDDGKPSAQPRPVSQNINVGNEMPLNMRFDLIMLLNGDPWNMRVPLASLHTSEIILCHDSEVAIYRQVATIRGESISKEGIKAFFGKTKYVYRAQMARITGEFPFRPYRMLGNPLLSISVPTETDWSPGIDVIKGEFDTGEMVITLVNKRVAETPYNPVYEFGVYLERGTGFMQHCTVATIVPKHIFMSKLSYPIDVRQIDFDYAPSIVFMEPNSSCNFHFPNRSRMRLLQLKRSPIIIIHHGSIDDDSDDGSKSDRTMANMEEDTWAGEVDISKLGIVYVRLRDPLTIIKVETEIVGGSLVSTFSEQSLIWPPYRIDNKSNADIRFREDYSVPANNASVDLLSVLPEQARLAAEEAGNGRETILLNAASQKDALRPSTAAGGVLPSSPVSSVRIVGPFSQSGSAWDIIDPKGTFPYTWDHPFTGNRTIRLEVAAAGQVASKLVSLDDDINDLTVTLKKKVPNLGNPLAEGRLVRCDANTEKQVYCILRPDILYVYEADEIDPAKHELLEVINLTKVKRSGKFVMAGVTRMMQEKSKDFLSNTFNDFFSNISSTVNFIRQRTKLKFDLNYIRSLMLKLGDEMGFFAQFSLDRVTTRRRAYSDENDVGLSLTANRSNNVSTDSLDSLVKDSLVPSGAENTGFVGDNEASSPSSPVVSKNLRLKELFSAGVSSQDLMDELPKHVVFTHQVIDAILSSSDKYNQETAKELCAWLILHEYLIPYDPSECIRTFSIDGAVSVRGSIFDSSFINTADLSANAASSSNAPNSAPPVGAPLDARPTLVTNASSSTIGGAPGRPTASLLNMSRQSKAMQYYQTLLQDCENMEMVFVPPPLNPEMLELQMSMLDDRGGRASIVNTAANTAKAPVVETFGFTFTISERTYSFKCASGDEFRGWIQSARLAIELGWVDYMTGRKPLSPPKISDYQITYHLKTRADGSTKVLEITEVGGGQDNDNKIVNRMTSTLADAFSFLPVFRRTKRALQASNLEELKEGIDADRALISVFFNVRSVSLSIIDCSPAEVMYIRLQDVVMNVIRYLRAVQFTVTVRQIQFVDQLLNPSFPVALFTRKLSPEEAKKIVLPGFEEGGAFGYPSLHLHLQQRYFKSAKTKANFQGGGNSGGGKKNGANENSTAVSPAHISESKLWYFDVFTLWLAPMHLGVDEEVFVRLFRFIHAIRTTIQEQDTGGKTRKLQEDAVGSASADYRLLSTDLDRHAMYSNYMHLLESGRSPYALFASESKRAFNIYFGLLQLYPLEVAISFRPSPDVKLTNAEYAIVSIIAQLDNAKIKLNSLFAENAFGSTVIIKEIIAKHYRAAFWKQFRNLIGATDIVEGSVGLVANLGTGVYDLFNESVEGLNPNEKKSFLHGLSKGGMSFATHTIGGTSGFTSRIAGGIGKGVSMLTLDTEFQRNRTYRKYNQANTLSEGLYVGTQELGRNIVEGVTGIVVSPYRGWEQGGGVGLATGMARGILGVALKPAVGVLDLASRATEGLRNTAMQAEAGISAEIEGVRRCRIPRAFGRSGMLQIYDIRAAAAQCMADYLSEFRYDPRLHVVAHLYCRRKIEIVRKPTRPTSNSASSHHSHSQQSLQQNKLRPHSHNYAAAMLVGEPVEDDYVPVEEDIAGVGPRSSFGRTKTLAHGNSHHNIRRYEKYAERDFASNPSREAWGLCEETEYVIVVTPDRVALVEVNSTASSTTAAAADSTDSSSVLQNTNSLGIAGQPQPQISPIAEEGDFDDNASVSSKATTASSIAPAMVSSGGGMFGAFRSKTRKLSSNTSTASITVNSSGNALPPAAATTVVSSLPPPSANKRCRFIWVCPANCIDELSSDHRGDMQLKLNTSVWITGPWYQRQPTILDSTIRNYTIFQSLLEQVIGVTLSRLQPLQPPYRLSASGVPRMGGLLQQGVRKKYSTGIRSVLMSPTIHTYWVYGHVLYEYTAIRGSTAAANAGRMNTPVAPGGSMKAAPASVAAVPPSLLSTDGPSTQSDLSDYFNIENSGDDQMLQGSGIEGVLGPNNRPLTASILGDSASVATAVPSPSVTGPSSSMTSAPVIITPIDDLMEKTIAALVVSSGKNLSTPGVEESNHTTSKKSHPKRRKHKSFTSQSSVPDKDSDDDDEAYNNSLQYLTSSSPSHTEGVLNMDHRSGSLGSLSDVSTASQTSHSSDAMKSAFLQPPELQDQYLSFVYPLVDITMHGPTPEDGGRFFSISIQRMDNAKMRCLRRDDPNEMLSEYMKSGLSLLFPTKELAMNWRLAIESRITLRPSDCLPQALLTTEDKKREYGRFLPLPGRSNAPTGEKQTLESVMTPVDGSVLGLLVLPTSGCAEKETETIKIEIFKTLSAIRRM